AAAAAREIVPGVAPPFPFTQLPGGMGRRGQRRPGRAPSRARAGPRRYAMGDAEQAILIDGSVLHNRRFGPAVAALEKRPSRREVDRRFVYIDPKPGLKNDRRTSAGEGDVEPPGFLSTLFGALSDIPREQPIRDNLESIK